MTEQAKHVRKQPTIVERRSADENHDVVTISGGNGAYRRRPCGGCPWIEENDGDFPAEAFRHSASTSYDMADNTFACHESGADKPSTCAGFLLRGGEHNMRVRMMLATGMLTLDSVQEDGRTLHLDYVDMAVANGVPEDDPVLAPSRRGIYARMKGVEDANVTRR